MSIPQGRTAPSMVDLHKAHAPFDESTSRQAALAERLGLFPLPCFTTSSRYWGSWREERPDRLESFSCGTSSRNYESEGQLPRSYLPVGREPAL